MCYFSDSTIWDVWNKFFFPGKSNLVLLVCFITTDAKVLLHSGFILSEIIIAINTQGRFNKSVFTKIYLKAFCSKYVALTHWHIVLITLKHHKVHRRTKANLCYFFLDRGPYHIETSPLICKANQWTGFYMIRTSVMKELIKLSVYVLLGKDHVLCSVSNK